MLKFLPPFFTFSITGYSSFYLFPSYRHLVLWWSEFILLGRFTRAALSFQTGPPFFENSLSWNSLMENPCRQSSIEPRARLITPVTGAIIMFYTAFVMQSLLFQNRVGAHQPLNGRFKVRSGWSRAWGMDLVLSVTGGHWRKWLYALKCVTHHFPGWLGTG